VDGEGAEQGLARALKDTLEVRGERPEEGEGQEGIGQGRWLTAGVSATGSRLEQSPEGERQFLAPERKPRQGKGANVKRATAGDELVRLVERQRP